jgi:hypothetical protein
MKRLWLPRDTSGGFPFYDFLDFVMCVSPLFNETSEGVGAGFRIDRYLRQVRESQDKRVYVDIPDGDLTLLVQAAESPGAPYPTNPKSLVDPYLDALRGAEAI